MLNLHTIPPDMLSWLERENFQHLEKEVLVILGVKNLIVQYLEEEGEDGERRPLNL